MLLSRAQINVSCGAIDKRAQATAEMRSELEAKVTELEESVKVCNGVLDLLEQRHRQADAELKYMHDTLLGPLEMHRKQAVHLAMANADLESMKMRGVEIERRLREALRRRGPSCSSMLTSPERGRAKQGGAGRRGEKEEGSDG